MSAKTARHRGLLIVAGITAALTFIMLAIGSTVNPTGSSLACPNWEFFWGLIPLCRGEVFPAMEGGVLYEHGHRLWGTLVGIATLATAAWAWLSKDVHKSTKWLTLAALILVILQGALGGLTVIARLHPVVSTAHLMLGYIFFCLTLLLVWRALPKRRIAPTSGRTLARVFLAVAFGLVLLQATLGGAIRHFGAGLICGDDVVGCAGQGLWPELGLAQLHMLHRFVGYAVAVAVVALALRAKRQASEAGRRKVATLAWAPVVLVIAQVALGLLTVYTGRSVAIVAGHTIVGGLLLASVFLLYIGFGPLGEPVTNNAAAASSPARTNPNPSRKVVA